MTENKITKRHIVNAIIALAESDANIEVDVDGVVVTSEDIKAFGETWLDQAAAKAEKAKERAKAKRAESDELTEEIATIIANAEGTITPDAIVQALNDAEVTKSKVTSRVAKLIKAGRVTKTEVDKRVAYMIAE